MHQTVDRRRNGQDAEIIERPHRDYRALVSAGKLASVAGDDIGKHIRVGKRGARDNLGILRRVQQQFAAAKAKRSSPGMSGDQSSSMVGRTPRTNGLDIWIVDPMGFSAA